MSSISPFSQAPQTEVREFDPGSAAASSEAATERSSYFDTLMQHVLARPERDADGPQRPDTSERPAPASARAKRKPQRANGRNRVSDPTKDSDSDDEETTPAEESRSISGSLENLGAAAAVVATLTQPPALPQTSTAQTDSSDAGGVACLMILDSAPGVSVRGAAQVSASPGSKADSDPVAQAGDQQQSSEEASELAKTLATELAASSDKSDPSHSRITSHESTQHTNPSKHGTEIEAEAQAPPVGISSAQQEEQMKKAVKTDKNADLSQQNLPSASHVSAANEAVLLDKKLPGHAIHVERTDSNIFTASVSNPPGSSVESTKTTMAATAITGTHNRVLEQAQELVSVQAERLRETGSDSLSVVVKPGDGTQISLQLQMREGVVSAQASLHRGDFELLSRHWPELQQRLQAQGIQLSSLQRQETSTSSDSRQPRHQTQPGEQGSTEISRAGSMTEPPGKRPRNPHSHRGWETWA